MEGYHRNYLGRNRRRQPYRPRAQNFGDRNFNRDYGYWQRRMGRPQPQFGVEHRNMAPYARARRGQWMNRVQFGEMYGADADYEDWMRQRRYRADDLNDPVVFDAIVADRRVNFEPFVYAPIPDQDEIEAVQYEQEILEKVERSEAGKRLRDEDE